jgi:hypothetical protein
MDSAEVRPLTGVPGSSADGSTATLKICAEFNESNSLTVASKSAAGTNFKTLRLLEDSATIAQSKMNLVLADSKG